MTDIWSGLSRYIPGKGLYISYMQFVKPVIFKGKARNFQVFQNRPWK